MKRSRAASTFYAGIAGFAALLVSGGPAAAGPLLMGGSITGEAGTRVQLQGFGFRDGPGWVTAGAATQAFSSQVSCCAGEIVSSSGEDLGNTVSAKVSLSASAKPGKLSASASGEASFEAPETFPDIGYSAAAGAIIRLRFDDIGLVGFGTLGDPAVVEMTLDVTDTLTWENFGGALVRASLKVVSSDTETDAETGDTHQVVAGAFFEHRARAPLEWPRTVSFQVNQLVGVPYQITYELEVFIDDSINSLNGETFAKSSVNASNSLDVFMDLVNPAPGQTLTSESGHNYSISAAAPSVPEPGTLALFASSLLGWAALRRRQRRIYASLR